MSDLFSRTTGIEPQNQVVRDKHLLGQLAKSFESVPADALRLIKQVENAKVLHPEIKVEKQQ